MKGITILTVFVVVLFAIPVFTHADVYLSLRNYNRLYYIMEIPGFSGEENGYQFLSLLKPLDYVLGKYLRVELTNEFFKQFKTPEFFIEDGRTKKKLSFYEGNEIFRIIWRMFWLNPIFMWIMTVMVNLYFLNPENDC